MVANLCVAIVGAGPAGEFIALLRVWRDLPSVQSVVMNPMTTAVSQNPSIIYAITGALAHDSDESTFEPILKYISRLPTEYQVLFMRDVGQRNKELQNNAAFINWASQNANVLL